MVGSVTIAHITQNLLQQYYNNDPGNVGLESKLGLAKTIFIITFSIYLFITLAIATKFCVSFSTNEMKLNKFTTFITIATVITIGIYATFSFRSLFFLESEDILTFVGTRVNLCLYDLLMFWMLLPEAGTDFDEEDEESDFQGTNMDSEPRIVGADQMNVSGDSGSEDSDDSPRDNAREKVEALAQEFDSQVRSRGQETGEIHENKSSVGKKDKKNKLPTNSATFLEDSQPHNQQMEIGEFELAELEE